MGLFFQRGGRVSYGPKGGVSCYRLRYVIKGKRPALSESMVIDVSLKGHPLAAIQELSHEAGHAAFPFQFNLSSLEAFHEGLRSSEKLEEPKAAYFKNRRKDEGAAIASNVEIRREFLAHGWEIGLAGNPSNHRFYNRVYDIWGNTPAAWERMGGRAAGREFSNRVGGVGKKGWGPQSYYEIWDKEFEKLTQLLLRLP